MGIVGTPVIDKARKHLYVVSCGAATSFRMYALDLSTGAVLDGWPVAIDEKTLEQPSINRNPRYGDTPAAPWRPGRFSIQRGALNLSPDDRYLFATIGQGRGWVVAIDTQSKISYRPSAARRWPRIPSAEFGVQPACRSTLAATSMPLPGQAAARSTRHPCTTGRSRCSNSIPFRVRLDVARRLHTLQLLSHRGGGCRCGQQRRGDPARC